MHRQNALTTLGVKKLVAIVWVIKMMRPYIRRLILLVQLCGKVILRAVSDCCTVSCIALSLNRVLALHSI